MNLAKLLFLNLVTFVSSKEIPDLAQGHWTIRSETWDRNPRLENGADLLIDGCKFRIYDQNNTRKDGNGIFYWSDDGYLVMKFDNNPKNERYFRQTVEGHFIHGKSPNAMYIRSLGAVSHFYRNLDSPASDQCSSGKTPSIRQDRVTIPDLGAGEWLMENESWAGTEYSKGKKFFTDGCHFRLDSVTNERNDGNGQFYWKNNRLLMKWNKSRDAIEFQYGRKDGKGVWYNKYGGKGQRWTLRNISGFEKFNGDTIYQCSSSNQFGGKYNANLEYNESPFIEEPPASGPMSKGSTIPTAIFHGITDGCAYTKGKRNERLISEGTGAYVKCINVGLPVIGSLLDNFHSIAQKACMKITQDENFDGEFNILGYSQGGLIGRYIVENCEMKGTVRNFVTLGTPHMGVNFVPYCPPGSNVLCEWLNKVTKYLVYYSIVQDWIAPAGYFRDLHQIQNYFSSSTFLASLNNELEKSQEAAVRKNRFSSLKNALFIMFEADSVIYPKESAWFQELDKAGHLKSLDQSEYYTKDFFGLKTLVDSGKAKFASLPGNHL